MDELTLLRELGEEIDRTAAEPTAATRHRVVSGIAGGTPGGGRRSWFTARRVVPAGALLAGGLAAAVALAVGGPGPAARTGPGPNPGVASETPETPLDARGILLAAARTARDTPSSAPAPNAFVYTRTMERGMAARMDGDGTTWRPYASTREAWLSADGSRDGAVTPSGQTELVAIPAHETTPAYDANLPTTAAAMTDYLYRDVGKGEKSGAEAVAFQAGRALSQESFMPPAARAALFEAMAAIPGVEVVRDAENVAGEKGVAVAFREGVTRDELLFDPSSHRVIGLRSVFVGHDGTMPTGTVTFSSAVLESAVVSQVRERPDGTFREGPIQGTKKEKG